MKRVKRYSLSIFIYFIAFSSILFCGIAYSQVLNEFQVGASRVNITPPEDAAFHMAGYGGRTEGFTGILDSLYFRTIVIDDGLNQAAIVVGDLLHTTEIMWERLSERIEKETDIANQHLLLAATHTHGAPTFLRDGQDIEGSLEVYINDVIDKIVQSIKDAQGLLVPAKIGVGKGYANININRVARTAEGGYWLGQNPDGPSDKTVYVVKFVDLNNNPIAILVNYAVHGVVGGPGNLFITADLPGATSRMVEE
jgi:neutral ceramidase